MFETRKEALLIFFGWFGGRIEQGDLVDAAFAREGRAARRDA
jgi:hypothetical protein